MEEGKDVYALRAALAMYLAGHGTPVIETYELPTLELLRRASYAYMKAHGIKGVVSYHFENDTK